MRSSLSRSKWLAPVVVCAALTACAPPAPRPTEVGASVSPSALAATVTPAEPTTTPDAGNASALAEVIRVTQPLPGAAVTSPLEVRGEARGTWYFEANFGLSLRGPDGAELAAGFATAQGDWMTEDFVPFTASLEFDLPAPAGAALLVLEKANPSGLAEHDAALLVPVKLGPVP
jgi:hypothetical protein